MKITIGTDLLTWSTTRDDIDIKLQIWDFAGEKRFRFFLPNYSRGAQGCILCFDISRYTSFQNLQEWFDIVKDNTNDIIFFLVGLKADLSDSRRTVQKEEAVKFKNEHNIPFLIETSSKTGVNNTDVFETLVEAMLKKRELI
jgi:small GTP-binding protein